MNVLTVCDKTSRDCPMATRNMFSVCARDFRVRIWEIALVEVNLRETRVKRRRVCESTLSADNALNGCENSCMGCAAALIAVNRLPTSVKSCMGCARVLVAIHCLMVWAIVPRDC